MLALAKRKKPMIPAQTPSNNPKSDFENLLQQAWSERTDQSMLETIMLAEILAPKTPEADKVIEKLYERWHGR